MSAPSDGATASAAADRKRLVQLMGEARHARKRFESYRTEVQGTRQAGTTQLRKLKEAAEYADARLERARTER